ncbi:MAG TPA: hypothetical protein VFZ61_30210, partial [Polyangiales bacterium]
MIARALATRHVRLVCLLLALPLISSRASAQAPGGPAAGGVHACPEQQALHLTQRSLSQRTQALDAELGR